MITTGYELEKKFLEQNLDTSFYGQMTVDVFLEQIEAIDPNMLDLRYKMTKKDQDKMDRMFKRGRHEDAIDFFTNKYLSKMSDDYHNMVKYALTLSTTKVLTAEKLKLLNNNITKVSNATRKKVDEFSKGMVDRILDHQKEITIYLGWKTLGSLSESAINNASFYNLGQAVGVYFFMNTEKAWYYTSRINQQVIRKYQRIMAFEKEQEPYKKKLLRRKIKIADETRRRMMKSNKSVFRSLTGEIKAQEERYRTASLEKEISNNLKQTAVGTERAYNEQAAELNEADVMEYYKASNRTIKTKPRVVCIEVLSDSLFGISLVALTDEAADKLNIPLLEDVKARGGLGQWCRHSVKPVKGSILKKINKMLKESEEKE